MDKVLIHKLIQCIYNFIVKCKNAIITSKYITIYKIYNTNIKI